MTQTVPLTAVLGPGKTGLTIGYKVLNANRTVYSGFATTNVAETGVAGTYAVWGGIVAPDAGGYVVVGTAAADLAEVPIEPAAALTLTAEQIRAAVGLDEANLSELLAGISTLDAAAIRTAIGMGSANLDTQLAALGWRVRGRTRDT